MSVLILGATEKTASFIELLIRSGYSVTVYDLSPTNLMRVKDIITGKLNSEHLNNVKLTNSLPDSHYNVILECLNDDLILLNEYLSNLKFKDGYLLVTTTLYNTVDKVKRTVKYDNVIGCFLTNYPVIPDILEVIASDNIWYKAQSFIENLRVNRIYLRNDVPGHMVNRIILRYIVETLRLMKLGYSAYDIEYMLATRLGIYTSPIKLARAIGRDALTNMVKSLSNKEFVISSIDKVVHEINEVFNDNVKSSSLNVEKAISFNPLNLIAPIVNEVAKLIKNGIPKSLEDVERAAKLIFRWHKGVMEYADDVGIDVLYHFLNNKWNATGYREYQPCPLILEMYNKGVLGKKTGAGFYKWKYEKLDLGTILYEKRDNYALVTISKPEKLNALDRDMWIGLTKAIERAEEDDDIKVIVITGEGKAFSAGDDIEMMSKWKGLEGKFFFENVASALFNKLIECKKPIIGLVRGYAFGGGMEICILLDIVIASESSIFSIPEGLLGALPPAASTIGIPLLGRKIIRYALTGDRISSLEAKQLGLVDVVVPDDQVEVTMAEYIDKICRLAPLSIRGIKSCVNSMKSIFKSQLYTGISELAGLTLTKDFKEGCKAFVEKRRPKWTGE